jgi:hypothetical protein
MGLVGGEEPIEDEVADGAVWPSDEAMEGDEWVFSAGLCELGIGEVFGPLSAVEFSYVVAVDGLEIGDDFTAEPTRPAGLEGDLEIDDDWRAFGGYEDIFGFG